MSTGSGEDGLGGTDGERGTAELPGGPVGTLLPIENARRDWHPILQEFVRSSLALLLVVLLGVTVVWSFLNAGDAAEWSNTKELLQLLLPAETALLGSAVGFYFGSRRE